MRIVITGGPGAGKTTVIKALQKRKFPVVEESALIVMNTINNLLGGSSQQASWRKDSSNKEKIWFQHELIKIALVQERILKTVVKKKDKAMTVFFDRGVYDTFAYLENLEDPQTKNEIRKLKALCEKVKYDYIFVLKTPSAKFFKTGPGRTSDRKTSVDMGNFHKKTYEKYFPGKVRVIPWGNNRVELILKILKQAES